MAKTERQQRLRAVDDLRDIADALDQAADLFEEALGDLDAATPDGGVKGAGRHLTYEAMEDQTRAYRTLMPAGMRALVEEHFKGRHEQDACPVCLSRQPDLPPGWLGRIWKKHLRKMLPEIREALDRETPQ